MDINEDKVKDLKKLVKLFCENRDWDQFHNPKDLSIGIITEAAELLEIFRFKTEGEFKKMLSNGAIRGKIQDELADIFFFLLRFSQKYDFDLADALREKIKKNEIKYPIERFKGSNRKYNEQQ